MKKIIYLFLIAHPFSALFAQYEKTELKQKPYNRWSVEFNAGQNKAVRPFAHSYYSSDPTDYFNFSGVNHFDIGLRYMLSNKFGFKFDFATDKITNQSGSGSLPFNVNQYRIGFQGVANLGRIMSFESFTNRFNILSHAGIQVSKLTPKEGINKNVTEDNGGIILGLTPQFKCSKWLVITGDFSVLSNVRQHLNWDGSISAPENNISGMMYNTSLGLTIYLGKKEKHADWYSQEDVIKEISSTDKAARRRIDDIESMLLDTDKDGVADFLDYQKNTPNGVAVDTKGRYFDVNRNGVPDELEKTAKDNNQNNAENKISKEEFAKNMANRGLINIFYNVNSDMPNRASNNNIFYIIQFLRNYPDAKVKLSGYADKTGNEKRNKELSQSRSKKLKDIIVAAGIDQSRVTISAEGVDSSYSSDNKIGLDLARRVSVLFE